MSIDRPALHVEKRADSDLADVVAADGVIVSAGFASVEAAMAWLADKRDREEY